MRIRSLALLFLVLSSCGDGSGGGDPIPREAFVEEYCKALDPCCGKANLATGGAQCRAFIGAFLPASGYDDRAGGECVAHLRRVAQMSSFCDAGITGAVPACNEVFRSGGRKQPGEACVMDSDCASSREGTVDCASSFSGNAETRRCQLQVRGKAGDAPCVGTIDDGVTIFSGASVSTPTVPSRAYLCHVQDGLFCDGAGACAKIAMVGEACTGRNSRECAKSAYCDSAAKTCQARKAAGAACTTTSQCQEGVYCPTATRTCTAQLADGAACAMREQCKSGRCVNERCVEASSTNLGLVLACGQK